MRSGLVASSLCAREQARRHSETADFEAIERSILEIEKQIRGLDEISRSAETIKSGSQKILDRARLMREALTSEIGALGNKVDALKLLLAGEGAA